jgi:DNA/RNA-binding domain of Phe-tRNA-synthetase-like protein
MPPHAMMDAMGAVSLAYDSHPLLVHAAFVSHFTGQLGSLPTPQWLSAGLASDAVAPVARSESARQAVRDLLRHGGYKPTGRSKPSSEYLLRSAEQSALRAINVAVDACNVVSLASGIPISVIDLDRVEPPLRVALAREGSYVFNASGQEIELAGLLCLFDASGPCANPVKDSERTKTRSETTRTLSILWGPRACAEEIERALAWYRELVERLGARTEPA